MRLLICIVWTSPPIGYASAGRSFAARSAPAEVAQIKYAQVLIHVVHKLKKLVL